MAVAQHVRLAQHPDTYGLHCAGLLDPQGGQGLLANGDTGGGDLNNDSSIPLMHVPQSFLDMDLPLRSLTPEDELATAKLNDDLAKQSTAALGGTGGVCLPPPLRPFPPSPPNSAGFNVLLPITLHTWMTVHSFLRRACLLEPQIRAHRSQGLVCESDGGPRLCRAACRA